MSATVSGFNMRYENNRIILFRKRNSGGLMHPISISWGGAVWSMFMKANVGEEFRVYYQRDKKINTGPTGWGA